MEPMASCMRGRSCASELHLALVLLIFHSRMLCFSFHIIWSVEKENSPSRGGGGSPASALKVEGRYSSQLGDVKEKEVFDVV